MTYVMGAVIPVPTANKQAYLDMAKIAAEVFKDLGALSVFEGWGPDIPPGEVTDFRKAVLAEDGEAIVFSWVVWPSKEVFEAAMPKMAEDERMAGEMPFDGERMIFGGFETIFEA
ncbi:MAG: DUF1428 domain-containing protein [Pseudomonadota bacterium]